MPAATPLSISAGAEAAGERRYLTVMFCDLVDLTGISARLDAEDWGDLLRDYLDAAAAVVKELGGHVARKVGDALMSLFGYPIAQENDAERAARAALGIEHAFAELNRKNACAGKPELAARIALDTGPAVIDAAGEIYGDVANIAARAQALAEPGVVVVTAQVQRQIAGLFVVEPGGTHSLKGVLEPTAVFRLVRASGGGRRSGQHQLTPLVGRDEEMALLVRRWETVRQGAGRLVLIVGEPGLGKSRLIEEFHRRLRDTPTPGSNGAAHNFCKTRHYIRSPIGAASGLAAPTSRGAAACRLGKYAHVGQARSGGECPTSGAAPRYSIDQ